MVINGEIFRKMCISAANSLSNNQDKINNLNVFPVPDGDTGINMSLTMKPVREIPNDLSDLSTCAAQVADKVLRSARGNSGAILSLFFRGLSKAFSGIDKADSKEIAVAFQNGTSEAYRAVMKPTEGTILTVMRETSEMAVTESGKYKGAPVKFFEKIVDTANATLAKTPDMLPILKEAGVVDAGGSGFVTMLEGMLASLKGNDVDLDHPEDSAPTQSYSADFSSFNGEDITFAYCTECIIGKKDEYIGEGNADKFRSTVFNWGDSMVFIDDKTVIKLHIHTNDPGRVLSEAVKYGVLETVKVENMKIQHSNLADTEQNTDHVLITHKYGFVAVCLGEGITNTFRELGADQIVSGGQTMNPSTEDLLTAIQKTAAEYVFVLPNNKNIIMVANQAAEMLEGSGQNIIVLPTKSVPQGMTAMLNFDPDSSPEDNQISMSNAISGVHTVSLTRAVREVKLGGKLIRKDEYIGLLEGKIERSGKKRDDILLNIISKFEDAEFITVFYGAAVNQSDAQSFCDKLQAILPEAEINLIDGGQPLYDFVISVE